MKLNLDNKWTKNPTLKDTAVRLSEVDNINFGRMRRLKKTGLFRLSTSSCIMNFVNACEYMHDCGIDSGFLQQVADAEGPEARLVLINAAHRIGWNEPDSTLAGITDRMFFYRLKEKGMISYNKNKRKAAHIDGLSSFLSNPIDKEKAKGRCVVPRRNLNLGLGYTGHSYDK